MKRRISYRDAVDFLGRSNDVIGFNENVLRAFASVGLVSLIFDVDVSHVAHDVVRIRKKVETPDQRRLSARLKAGAKKQAASGGHGPWKSRARAAAHLERMRAYVRVLAHVERRLERLAPDEPGRVGVRMRDVHLEVLARELLASGVLAGIIAATSRFLKPYLQGGKWESDAVGTADDWAHAMRKLARKPRTAGDKRRDAARAKLFANM